MNAAFSKLARALTLPALAGTSLLLVAHGGNEVDADSDCTSYQSSYAEFDASGDCGIVGEIQAGTAAGKCDIDIVGIPGDDSVGGRRGSREELSDGRWQFTWERSPGDMWTCYVGDPRSGSLPLRCEHFDEICHGTFAMKN